MSDPVTGHDVNYQSVADETGVILENQDIGPRDPWNYDTILKFSHAVNCAVKDSVVSGFGFNRESAVDMNRECANVVVANCRLAGGKRDCITIKGGCRNITIQDTVLQPSGHSGVDIDLGNWSDQSFEPVAEVCLTNVRTAFGEPIRLRVGRAKYPHVIGNTQVEYLWFQSLLLKAYWWSKFILRKLKLA